MSYQILKLEHGISFEIVPDSLEATFTPHVKAEIEKIWHEEQQKREIFNGKILDVLSWNNPILTGRFVEYKSYLAQLRNPALKEVMPIHVLGITGITQWQEQYLIGCRQPFLTLYANYFEFAPSGGFDDTAIWQKQLFQELEDELGIFSHEIISLKPHVLIREEANDHYELCIQIILNPELSQKQIFPKTEYSSLLWLDKKNLKSFSQDPSHQLVPLTLELIHQDIF